jgi:hypothetical protein
MEFSMDPVEEFRRYANECRRMARSTRDPKSQAEWNSLAERWLHCAELAVGNMAMAGDPQRPRERLTDPIRRKRNQPSPSVKLRPKLPMRKAG